MNPQNWHIVTLEQLGAVVVRQYGGKASNLATLVTAGVSVPPGVAIGKDVQAYFLRANGIDLAALEHIHNLGMVFLESVINEAQVWQQKIVDTIAQAPFPPELEEALLDVLSSLIHREVAVRSSGVVEDSSLTSFAGQYATILNVSGRDSVLNAIRKCWSSQYEGRVLSYAIARRGMPVLMPSMGVLIQEMLAPDFAGVCFTEGPTPKTRQFMIIESVPGVGESLVSGTETPSHFEVHKDGTIHRAIVPPSAGLRPSDEIIALVAAEAKQIAAHIGTPQDIEWAVTGGKLFILQTRPITVIGGENTVVPMGLPRSFHSQSDRDDLVGSDSASTILRDDLHEWLITHVDPLIYRGTSYLLSSQRNDGAWRIEGYPEWSDVGTAMIVQMIIDGRIPSNLQWSIPRPKSDPAIVGIPAAINWLAKNIKDDGTWGTDLWDTSQVVRAFIKSGVSTEEPIVKYALSFVSDALNRNLNSFYEQEWFGGGVFAVALRLFSEAGMSEMASRLTELLLNQQNLTGEFCGPSRKGREAVPSEWHTAQAISALASCAKQSPEVDQALAKSCRWLVSRQRIDGSWGVKAGSYSHFNIFFTSYAVIALKDAGNEYIDSMTRGYKWLRGKQVASGAFGDLGSTIMAITAIQRLHGSVFTIELPIPIFLRIQSTLGGSNQ